MTIAPGENVGPYRVIEQLGSGGMATVFKSYHAALDRYVAIKVLHAAFKADPQFFERFKREARIVAKLEHPNIIPVYDFNEHHGEPYLVMRFIEGDTLKRYMTGKPMAPAEVLRLLRPVAEALAYAHAQGVLHRDIKPSNIMVTKEGNIFVTDFGLARMVEAGESTLSQDMMVGTPQYISPEQAQGIKELDGRTDVYSLGVVLYEMLTGRVPFSADTPFATVHDHIYTPLPLPSSINPEIDPTIERLLLKALAKDPNDRFGTATELLQAFETAFTAAPTVAKPAPETVTAPKSKKGRPWWVWAGAATLVMCLILSLLVGISALRRAKTRSAQNQPIATQIADNGQPALPPAGAQPGNPPSAGEPGQPLAPPGEEPGQAPPLSPGVNPDSPEYKQAADLSQQAIAAMRQDNLDKAAELHQQAIDVLPQYLPAYFGLSETLKRQGDDDGSLEVLEDAVDENPDVPDAHLRLGQEYLNTKDPEAALDAFIEAAKLRPNDPAPYAGQAIALTMQDKPDEAKAALDKALQLDPFNPEARLANAFYLFRQGDRIKAVQELRNLIQDQRVPVFAKERARILLDQIGK